jgi:polyketide cyclase/dehydrase/lipid transport protein
MAIRALVSDVHYEAAVVVKATLERTYLAYTDFESMSKWSKQASAVRILKKEGDTVQLEVETASGAGSRRMISELKLRPPASVESEGETRFTRTRRTVSFAEVPEGTRVTASLDVNMKGSWGWILRTHRKAGAESSASEELASFASYVESLG